MSADSGHRFLDWTPVPTFCRHNRFAANCPICSREADEAQAALRRPKASRPARATRSEPARTAGRPSTPRRRAAADLHVSRDARAADDGYRSPLAPGLRARPDAERLADELAFAAARLDDLEDAPNDLYAEVAHGADDDEALWLAFLLAYLGPLDGEDPFAGARAARTTWASGAPPRLDGVPLGPRTAHDPGRGTATPDAFRAWASRAGSPAAAFQGEVSWSPERRFERVFERLALPGLHRAARLDLLVTLGRLGRVPLRPTGLRFAATAVAADDEALLAAKRVLGIGDPLLLERRAADLAHAADVPVEAVDLALFNWSRPVRSRAGARVEEPSAERRGAAAAALAL